MFKLEKVQIFKSGKCSNFKIVWNLKSVKMLKNNWFEICSNLIIVDTSKFSICDICPYCSRLSRRRPCSSQLRERLRDTSFFLLLLTLAHAGWRATAYTNSIESGRVFLGHYWHSRRACKWVQQVVRCALCYHSLAGHFPVPPTSFLHGPL
jgi:hypothetical protein